MATAETGPTATLKKALAARGASIDAQGHGQTWRGRFRKPLGRDQQCQRSLLFRGARGDVIKMIWHDGDWHVVVREAAGARAIRLAVAGRRYRRDLGGAAG